MASSHLLGEQGDRLHAVLRAKARVGRFGCSNEPKNDKALAEQELENFWCGRRGSASEICGQYCATCAGAVPSRRAKDRSTQIDQLLKMLFEEPASQAWQRHFYGKATSSQPRLPPVHSSKRSSRFQACE